jgi:hypothetical protein
MIKNHQPYLEWVYSEWENHNNKLEELISNDVSLVKFNEWSDELKRLWSRVQFGVYFYTMDVNSFSHTKVLSWSPHTLNWIKDVLLNKPNQTTK